MRDLQFVDTRRAAEMLGIAFKTLERWRWAGRGPSYRRFGGAVRYAIDDLEAWAASCRRESTSDPGPA